jgi:hypothetical protein
MQEKQAFFISENYFQKKPKPISFYFHSFLAFEIKFKEKKIKMLISLLQLYILSRHQKCYLREKFKNFYF